MLRVVLTGGLACGKSTVARELARLGCVVLSADEVGHAVLEPGGHLVIQVVNVAGMGVGESRALPLLRPAGGVLERRRTLLSEERARFDTCFQPPQGPAYRSQVMHRRMAPERAADLLRQAGLEPGAPLADEAGAPFTPAAPGWLLIAGRGR